MLEGVQADGGLPLWRFGASALQGVLSVGLGLSVARHDIDLSVIFMSITLKKDCKAGWLDIQPQLQNF